MKKKRVMAAAAALLLLCAVCFAARQAWVARNALLVLMYHHVVPDGEECNDMTVTTGRLEEDLQWLADNGYETVLPRELAEGKPLPDKPVLITFDDGYRSNYELAYPLLQKYQDKAAISLMVYMQDNGATEFLSWDMCREMEASGLVEIGSHTYLCHNLDERRGSKSEEGPNGIQRDPAESDGEFQARVLDDIQLSYDLITEALGHPPVLFAYPYGLPEPEAEELIHSLFPVTVLTNAAMADLSKGLHDLPRYTITMEKAPDYWANPPFMHQLKQEVKSLLNWFRG